MLRKGWFAVLLLPFAAALPRAEAKLDATEWKTVETEYARLYVPPPGKPGFGSDKATLVEMLVKDGESRSWKYLGEALVNECSMWLEAQRAVQQKEDQVFPTLKKATKDRTPDEEQAMFKAQAELPKLEQAAAYEREVLDGVVKAIANGPLALKGNLYGRAKASPDWLFRAAVAQLAAATPLDKEAAACLVRALTPANEKDPRVRLATLDALSTLPDGAEEHVLGRLADPEWTVQLLAVRIVREKKVARAIPHLITALERANPRMQDDVGTTLKELTGQNFDPFADVWAKWWAENKEKFSSTQGVKVGGRPKDPPVDNTIYGVPIKSDRILFVLDISGSMKDPLKNPQPPTPTSKGPITPKDGDPPPPPPPEEMISGPKIDVAKHELKKAIEKLPKTAKFGIVAYNHATLVWKEHPVDASPENKEEAFKWIRDFKASGSTFTDGALRVAFRIAGLGAIDKAYPEVVVDTIILISDGAPTDNAPDASKVMDFHVILQHVKEWNARGAVVIHTIAIDMTNEVNGNEFLKTLAEQNKGTFTPIPKPKAPPPAPAKVDPPKPPAPQGGQPPAPAPAPTPAPPANPKPPEDPKPPENPKPPEVPPM